VATGYTAALPALIAVCAAVLGAGCSGDAEAEADDDEAAPDTARVEVVRVETQTQALPIRTSGRLARKTELDLAFKVGGVVDDVLVEEGEAVRRGQVLARLQQTEMRAQAQAAESGLEKAKRDLARVKRLYRDSVATLEDVQNARTAVEQAASDAQIASFNRRHATITAPMGGQILNRRAEESEFAPPGEPVLTLGADAQGWVVRVGLADRDVVRLTRGDSAVVTFDAFPRRTFPAVVTQIADAAASVSGTFEVELTVPDLGERLKSGFIGKVDIFPSASAHHTVVPVEALVEGGGGEGVLYVLGSDSTAAPRARRTRVRIVRLTGEEIAVAGGALDSTSRVVTAGAPHLTDGQLVEVVE